MKLFVWKRDVPWNEKSAPDVEFFMRLEGDNLDVYRIERDSPGVEKWVYSTGSVLAVRELFDRIRDAIRYLGYTGRVVKEEL